MSNDTAPSQLKGLFKKRSFPTKWLKGKKVPLPGGQVYIGMSNTRGVLMQIHAKRFQEALRLNLTGLAAMVAWLSTIEHMKPLLVISAVGCIVFIVLNIFWMLLLSAVTMALKHYGERIEALVYDLGIEGHLARGQAIPRDPPPVGARSLYVALIVCIVAWAALFALILFAVLGG